MKLSFHSKSINSLFFKLLIWFQQLSLKRSLAISAHSDTHSDHRECILMCVWIEKDAKILHYFQWSGAIREPIEFWVKSCEWKVAHPGRMTANDCDFVWFLSILQSTKQELCSSTRLVQVVAFIGLLVERWFRQRLPLQASASENPEARLELV